ncbi:hypothetical protein [Streptomyces tsukubensis]|uniref:Macro domain-containing protein n=1 Tax=Streptomyces tsukubensis TaxID=83656 RepID=A0A1V4AFF8_9ACTN|nr:hypothetical protein [Streptomyces tsukubensis]OON82784.1 hypothetical protein B1H18_01740 [Streptomyces tsukubensis]QFR92040.1 hypothetical protein GBW32_01945 [Streptomyces tsukubensis]
MAHPFPLPDYGALLAEVRMVRRAGVVGLRSLPTPGLSGIVERRPPGALQAHPATVEELLRTAVSGIGGGTLQTAAEYSLGLAGGTRDWPAADRRRRAAQVYGVSVERFRKHHELMVLGQIVERILLIAAPPTTGTALADRLGTGEEGGRAAPSELAPSHRTLTPLVHGRHVTVTVHIHSVDLLRDVDVVVSPSNTYFVLPAPFKSSVAATLRRAGARKDPTGGLVEDCVHDELRGWAARNGMPGRAALPGTVAPTSAGALGEQGLRRIYHAAVAVPRPDSNDYDVRPAVVTRSVAAAFALLARESAGEDPPLLSICLPLLGSGRGGLTPLESFGALWPAVEAELARGAPWEIHFVVRGHAHADLVERLLAGPAERTYR